jgi:membrane protease YdiL (CAAX protease family)
VTGWLTGSFKVLYTSLTPQSSHWWTPCLLELFGGICVLVFRRALAYVTPSIAQAEASDYSLRGSAFAWLAVFTIGAIAEEVWRASCIRSLQHNPVGPVLANVLAAVSFSVAHMSGLPPRIPAGLGIAGAEAVVGLMFGALFMTSGNVLSACLASIVYYTANYFLIRRKQLAALGPITDNPADP